MNYTHEGTNLDGQSPKKQQISDIFYSQEEYPLNKLDRILQD